MLIKTLTYVFKKHIYNSLLNFVTINYFSSIMTFDQMQYQYCGEDFSTDNLTEYTASEHHWHTLKG